MKDIFQFDLQHLFRIISAGLIVFAQLNYIYKLSKKEVRPRVVSWLGWSILMGISFISQSIHQGWTLNLASLLLSTLGCFTIAFTARFIFRYFTIEKQDWKFLYYGLCCILIYLFTSNSWLTTFIAIAADFILAIPTLLNAYKNPEEEKAFAWPLALISWLFTMAMLTFEFSWLHALWPVYLILFNGTMTYLTYIKKRKQE